MLMRLTPRSRYSRKLSSVTEEGFASIVHSYWGASACPPLKTGSSARRIVVAGVMLGVPPPKNTVSNCNGACAL